MNNSNRRGPFQNLGQVPPSAATQETVQEHPSGAEHTEHAERHSSTNLGLYLGDGTVSVMSSTGSASLNGQVNSFNNSNYHSGFGGGPLANFGNHNGLTTHNVLHHIQHQSLQPHTLHSSPYQHLIPQPLRTAQQQQSQQQQRLHQELDHNHHKTGPAGAQQHAEWNDATQDPFVIGDLLIGDSPVDWDATLFHPRDSAGRLGMGLNAMLDLGSMTTPTTSSYHAAPLHQTANGRGSGSKTKDAKRAGNSGRACCSTGPEQPGVSAPCTRSRRNSVTSSCDSDCSSQCDIGDRCDASVCDSPPCEDPQCQTYTCEDAKAAAALASFGEESDKGQGRDLTAAQLTEAQQQGAIAAGAGPLTFSQHSLADPTSSHADFESFFKPDALLQHVLEAHDSSGQASPTCVRPCILDDPRFFKNFNPSCVQLHEQVYDQAALGTLQPPENECFTNFYCDPAALTEECSVPFASSDDFITHFNEQHRPVLMNNQMQCHQAHQFSYQHQNQLQQLLGHYQHQHQHQQQLQLHHQQQPPPQHPFLAHHHTQSLDSSHAPVPTTSCAATPTVPSASLSHQHFVPMTPSSNSPGTIAQSLVSSPIKAVSGGHHQPQLLPTPPPGTGAGLGQTSEAIMLALPRRNSIAPSNAGQGVDDGEDIKINRCLWCDDANGSCDLVFGTPKELNDHVISFHIRMLAKGSSGYLCLWKDCKRQQKGFPQKSKIERHVQTHTGEKPFQCNLCPLTFSAKQALDQHILIHNDLRPLECPYPGCTKRFRQQSARTMHLRTHTKTKPLKCDECGRCFSESSNLSKHRRTHQPLGAYACEHPGCTKTFHRQDQLRRHQRVHNNGLPADPNNARGGGRGSISVNQGAAADANTSGVDDEDGDDDDDEGHLTMASPSAAWLPMETDTEDQMDGVSELGEGC